MFITLVDVLYRTPLLLYTWSRRILTLLPTSIRWGIALFRLVFFTFLLIPVWTFVIPRYYLSSLVIRGVPYGPYLRNDCDIYIPSPSSSSDASLTSPSYPVLIFAPGGAWIIGYKLWGILIGFYYSLLCNTVVFILDYRNYPQSCITGQIADIELAINYLTANHGAVLRQYYGNPDYIYLMAQSAGAHLCVCALIERSLNNNNGHPHCMPIRRYFGIAGPYDVVAAAPHFATKGFGYDLLHALFEADLERYSPNRYLESLITILTTENDRSTVPRQRLSIEYQMSSSALSSGQNSPNKENTETAAESYVLRNRWENISIRTDKSNNRSNATTDVSTVPSLSTTSYLDTIDLLVTPTALRNAVDLTIPHVRNENEYVSYSLNQSFNSVTSLLYSPPPPSLYPEYIEEGKEGIHTSRILRSSSVSSTSSLLPCRERSLSISTPNYRSRQLSSTTFSVGLPSVNTETSLIEADPQLFEATAPMSSIVTLMQPSVSSTSYDEKNDDDPVGVVPRSKEKEYNETVAHAESQQQLQTFIRSLPMTVHFFHGDHDAVIPLSSSLSMAKAFQNLFSLSYSSITHRSSPSSLSTGNPASVHSMYNFMLRHPTMNTVMNDQHVSVHVEYGSTHTSPVLESLLSSEPPSMILRLIHDLIQYDQQQEWDMNMKHDLLLRNKNTMLKSQKPLLMFPLPLWYIRFAMWINPF